jgi:hypothetical protein
MWLVDVDDTDLPSLARPLRALARFKARDHLGDPRRSLRQNIEHYLAGNGIDLAGGRVLLLTSPRSLGHAFNPLSVWWCHHARCCPHPLAGGPPLGAPPASSTVPAAVRKQVCSDRTHRALAGQPGPHSPGPPQTIAVPSTAPSPSTRSTGPTLRPSPPPGSGRAVAKSLFRRIAGRLDVRVEPAAGLATPAVVWGAGGADAPVLRLVRPDAFFARVGQGGLIGFGESYMAGDWAADDLAGVLTVFAAQMAKLVPPWLQRLRDLYVQRHPSNERCSVDNAQSNISRHYDLSNELFESFLDPTMTYSSALFEEVGGIPLAADELLLEAQERKIDALLDALGVTAGTDLVEIGTGWGELATRVAGRGARVHSVTL